VYERDALQLVVNDFGKLLNADPPEESVQQFLRDYPVLLHQFSPERIFYKPPILSKFEADVVILNHKKELVLIELERPGKRLLIKDGGMAAETQHAFKQVNDWLYEASEHRSAVLSCLDLQPGDVNKIRGVVITGRDQGYDDSDLRKLKWTDFGQVDLFTYDDLIGSLVALVRGMSDL
jgi:hypothetical protein